MEASDLKTVLVTGCAGFIGSTLSGKLLHQGYAVVGIDNFDPYYPREIKERNLSAFQNHASFRFYEADVLDEYALEKFFEAHSFDHVVHLAAKAGVRPSLDQPLLYERVNVNGTENVLKQCARRGVKHFILASSSSVYGNDFGARAVETLTDLRPISPYAVSKLRAEQLALKYHQMYGMDMNVLRFFTAYGPGQRPDMAFMKFAKAILEGKPVQLYGGEKMGRDFTYIEDIINGIILALSYRNGYEIFNLGSGREVKVAAVIRLLAETLGKEALVEEIEVQAGDPVFTLADISKAKRLLKYLPEVEFSQGIRYFCDSFTCAGNSGRNKSMTH
jgi:UDP-glucuronate 4-epimerase